MNSIRMSLTRDPAALRAELPPDTFRRVLSYANGMRRQITAFLGMLLIGSGLVVVQPLLVRRLVDDGIGTGNSGLVTGLALLTAAVAVVDAGLGLWARAVSSRIGEGLIYTLRCQVFDHIQQQSMAFFMRTQTGSLVSRVNSDVIGAQRAFTSTLSGVVGNLIRVVAVLIGMALLNWQITLASLLLVPLFLVPVRLLGRRLQRDTAEQMDLNAEMQSTMTERFNVAGALLAKIFGSAGRELAEFSGRSSKVRDIGIRIALANFALFTALTLIGSLATAMAYGLGGVQVVAGSLTLGSLLAFIALLAQLYGPLTALSTVRVDVMTALVSFHRVFEVLDLPPLVLPPTRPIALPSGPLTVRFEGVGFTYPGAEQSLASLENPNWQAEHPDGPTLRGIDFEIAAGTLTALVGPSGAGKTTSGQLLMRLFDPTEGRITLGGVDLRLVAPVELQSTVSMVTQEAHLFHDTLAANLRYARPLARDEELVAALAEARLGELLNRLPQGLETVVGERGHRLSGGEKQRVAIARLLLRSPRVVVLDEATAHLDSESENAIQQALKKALAGRTSLVIAHRLATVREADQIVVLNAGAIEAVGRHDELVSQPGTYQEFCRLQFA